MRNILKTVTALLALLVLTLALAGGLYWLQLRSELDPQIAQIERLKTARDALASEVYDRNGIKIGEYASERRYFVPLNSIPAIVKQAFLSAEDKDFYKHHGISPLSIVRAAGVNMRGGRVIQGASTITQQLARLSFLDQDRTLERKLKEAILAMTIEKQLGKDRILELYLNKIYLGGGSYGVEAAARNYFRKHVSQLSIGEAAMLAGLAKSPTRYAPTKNPLAARQRQRAVLKRMREDKVISSTAAALWSKQSLNIESAAEDYANSAPYFIQHVASELRRRLGLLSLTDSGFKIYTTLDSSLQAQTAAALESTLNRVRGTAQTKTGQIDIQGAIVSLDPVTGGVLAMQGGGKFSETQFNRSAETQRPIGALLVPLYVALALDHGFRIDSPVDHDPYGGVRKAASNVPKLFDLLVSGDIGAGIPLFATLGQGTVASLTKRLGLPPGPADFRLALGNLQASPLEVATAYSIFVHSGKIPATYMIDRVIDASGRMIYHRPPFRARAVLSDAAANQAYTGLVAALNDGHARPSSPNRSAHAAAAAAATEDLHDSWYVGLLSDQVTAVWLGSERGGTKIASTAQLARSLAADTWANMRQCLTPSHEKLSDTYSCVQNRYSAAGESTPKKNSKN